MNTTPYIDPNQWKWYKMVEVNGASKHGRYTQILLNSLHVMSNVKVFATQDGWSASQTNMTHYIDLHDTHMDQW